MCIEREIIKQPKPQRGGMCIENGQTKCLKAPEGRHVYSTQGSTNNQSPRGAACVECVKRET